MRVLIVDDEPLARERLATLLRECGNASGNVEIAGEASNGRDAADRIREESLREETTEGGYETRDAARDRFELSEENDRLRPLVVDTRRGFDQFQRVRESLARLEFTDGFDFAHLALEMAARIPRDATVVAILPRVPVDSAIALGTLRRQGFAVTAILIGLDEEGKLEAHGRLLAQTIRDIRYVNNEDELAQLSGQVAVEAPASYAVDIPLA
jgi:CheY-like chemotaxis protein